MKQVHWQLPFVSLKGVAYRIDIYAEGAPVGGIKQLTGGATPFVTDEDNSDDFFAPVRGWTGMINVVDADGMLKESMMPKDNTDKHVRLIRVSDDKVMWQGFLSCEDFSQPYTCRPGEVSFNVVSMIEAMKSVSLDTKDMGFKTIRRTIADALDLLYRDIEKVSFDGFYYPVRSWEILKKYIDNSFMYKKKEQDNEDSTTYTLEGISVYEAMKMICTTAGWCLRERGQDLYLTEKCGDGRYYADKYARFRLWHTTSIPGMTIEQIRTIHLSELEYMDIDHQKEYHIGAKSVEVVAKLSKYDFVIPFPKCPYENLSIRRNECYLEGKADDRWLHIELCHTPNADGTLLGYYARRLSVDIENDLTLLKVLRVTDINYQIGNMSSTLEKLLAYNGTATQLSENYRRSWLGGKLDRLSIHFDYPICAMPCRYQVLEHRSQTPNSPNNAIYIQGFNTESRLWNELPEGSFVVHVPDIREDMSLFKMKSLSNVPSSAGLLTMRSAAEFITPGIGFGGGEADIYIAMSVKIGNYYLHRAPLGEEDGYWDETFDYIAPHYINKSFEITHKVDYDYREPGVVKPAYVSGELEVKIYGLMGGDTLKDKMPAYNALITSLDFGFIGDDSPGVNDRAENHYYLPLTYNFGNDVSITSEMASNMNNKRSPSMLMENSNTPISNMEYNEADGIVIHERPERDLLTRMARHYKNVTRGLKLTTGMNAENDTPMVSMIGYPDKPVEYDTISESIDWKQDKTTIKCEEIGQ